MGCWKYNTKNLFERENKHEHYGHYGYLSSFEVWKRYNPKSKCVRFNDSNDADVELFLVEVRAAEIYEKIWQ